MKFLIPLFTTTSLILFLKFVAVAQPNPYSIQLGKVKVTAISDGTVFVDTDIVFNSTDRTTKQKLKNNHPKHTVELSVNVYLIQMENRNIIIDTGSGSLMGDYGGKLQHQLQSIALDFNDITDVLISHIHADHSGGLVVKGKKMFPKATIHIHKYEVDYWLSEHHKIAASKDHIGANPSTFENAQRMLSPYLQSGQVVPFEKDAEVIKGIQTRLYPGHSPGHTVFILSSGDHQLYFLGDLIHIHDFQLKHPEVEMLFDVDRTAGVSSRSNFIHTAAAQKYFIAGSHISFPGFGRIQQIDNTFTWKPIHYSEYGSYD